MKLRAICIGNRWFIVLCESPVKKSSDGDGQYNDNEYSVKYFLEHGWLGYDGTLIYRMDASLPTVVNAKVGYGIRDAGYGDTRYGMTVFGGRKTLRRRC